MKHTGQPFDRTAEILVALLELLENLIGFLLIPSLLIFYGVANACPWGYYAISIGAYLLLFAGMELLLHIILKKLDKTYTPFLERIGDRIGILLTGSHTKS